MILQTNLARVVKMRKLEALPNIEPPSELSAQVLLLRVTTTDKDKLRLFLNNYDKYVFAKELSKKQKEHYHCVIYTEDDIEEFRKQFKDKFPECNSGHLYNLQIADYPENGVIYLTKQQKDLKSGDLEFKGFTKNYIESCMKKSFEKCDKKALMRDLKDLEDNFMITEMSEEMLLQKFMDLKCIKYNQNPNWNYACQWVERCYIRRVGHTPVNMCHERYLKYQGIKI